MKKLLSFLVGLVLAVAFGGTVFYLYGKSRTVPVTYKTESPTIATIIKKTVATGSVVPRKEVAIKPQVSGIVESIQVEPGKGVRKGDMIAKIRIIPNMVTLANAESRVNVARIRIEDAERELARNQKMYDEGIIPETTFRQMLLARDSAREEVAAAADNLELIRKGSTARSGDTSNTLVRATIDGMVLEVPVKEGSSVIEANTFNDGTTIATVADMAELIFEGKVDESEVGKIRPGMELLLTIGALEPARFKAVLERIAPKGVAENGAIQFQIRAALEQGDKDGPLIRANYSANADIVLDRRNEVLAIKESLLQFEGDKPFVEVETAPQKFEKRTIQTGLSDGIVIEVVSGLTKSDRVKAAAAAASTGGA